MPAPDSEEQIDAKIKETDLAIAELQKVRLGLFSAKRALKTSNVANVPTEAPKPALDDKTLEKIMNRLEWNSFKKKDGEWAFLRNRDGSLVEDLKPAAEFVDQLRKGRRLVLGKYEYVASEDKFLNRYAAATR